MVLLFSFFFCSGGFLVGHAEEPYAPMYVTGEINFRNGENLKRTSGPASGSYYASTGGFFWQSSGGFFGSFRYYSANGTMGFSETGDVTATKFGMYMSGLNGTFHLKSGQIYAVYLAGNLGSSYIPQSGISIFDGSSSYHLVYSDDDTICFYFDDDQCLNDLRFDASFSSPTTFKLVDFNIRYASIQTLTGFTKDDSSADIIAAIENQTGELDQSITDAGQGVQDKIESQFDTSQGAEVGSAAQGFADQAAESLGVVSYVDTLFSGLSGLVTAGSTTLTFPAFAIAVQGTDYQVWQEHTFDLSQLDGWFAGLMAAVRLATSVVVVGAVIHYLQSVYKDVIG